uniref:NEDD8-activating enzyme E1 regulatory subunit n=1 Tax=Arcella intermedia TaxID=1963864 RepID=A0A6B2L1E8_9EUKA
MRLWGPEGQSRIENAHICLLNGGALGSETLKNLVLPGIGEFTIVDGNKVTLRDLGNNFFVEQDSIGKSRAEEVTRLLYELNDMVKDKHSIQQDPDALIESNPDFVKDYTIIIATEINPLSLLRLSQACTKYNKILVSIKINGLIGQLRIQAGEHTIVQSKPSFPPEDLRLNTPFPALAEFAASVSYDALDNMQFAHIPFPVILLKEIEAWKAAHEGRLPQADQEKDEFRAQIRSRKRKPDNENFDEAAQKAHFAWIPYQIPDGISSILNDPKATNVTPESTNFWLLAAAVAAFVKNEGQGRLPLMGTIPDMTADTQSFIGLQMLFREKALSDAACVGQHLRAILARLGLPPARVPDEEVQAFCKFSLFLQVLRYSTLEEEGSPEKVNKEAIGMALVDFLAGDDAPGEGCWYMALRAADRFYAAQGRYPGDRTQSWESDFEVLRGVMNEELVALGFEPTQIDDKFLRELCRFGNSQIHNLAAILGGIAAQEIIKLVTCQWVPLNNTFIFNGINSTSVSLCL